MTKVLVVEAGNLEEVTGDSQYRHPLGCVEGERGVDESAD